MYKVNDLIQFTVNIQAPDVLYISSLVTRLTTVLAAILDSDLRDVDVTMYVAILRDELTNPHAFVLRQWAVVQCPRDCWGGVAGRLAFHCNTSSRSYVIIIKFRMKDRSSN